ncbi:nitroreductase family protein [Carnobacteriaceae bacterium zg-ZUI252]|nr:nitroreductase family protein [Carnobacteriaceae bacterium zg-ZUI252]MBS4770721.1 nitroreductase family protein [Carnobacteriaceae bacterium zg-ZUI240]
MNAIINLLKNHVTVRQFNTNTTLTQQEIDDIIASSKQAASWMNGQAYSIIVFKDEDKQQLVDLLSQTERNQTNAKIIESASLFLLYCLDFNQYFIENNVLSDSTVEPVLIATTDASLALQNAVVAAESLGLHTCIIGGIRNDMDKLIAALNLPQHVFPFVSVAIGKALQVSPPKPRLSHDVNVHYGFNYNTPQRQDVDLYTEQLSEYSKQQNYTSDDWVERFQKFYENKRYPSQTESLLKQQDLL